MNFLRHQSHRQIQNQIKHITCTCQLIRILGLKLQSPYQFPRYYQKPNTNLNPDIHSYYKRQNKKQLYSTVAQEQPAQQQNNQASGTKFWGQNTLIQYGEKGVEENVYGLQEVPMAQVEDLQQLVNFISSKKNLVVLTGAGVSTESNIPDYRGPQGAYKTGFQPMTHQTFVTNELARKRYWARSFAGWYEFNDKKYNGAHDGLARLEKNGWVKTLITQNVDNLHESAGSRNVIQLHGTLHRVKCQNCSHEVERNVYQKMLENLNPLTAEKALSYYRAYKLRQQQKLQDVKVKQKQINQEKQEVSQSTSQNLNTKSQQNQIPNKDEKSNINTIQSLISSQKQKIQPKNTQKNQSDDNQQIDESQIEMKITEIKDKSQQQKLRDVYNKFFHPGQSERQKEKSESGPFQVPVRRPDGDVELLDAGQNFFVQDCPKCRGIMKPDVVYFGDNVPKERANLALQSVVDSDGFLIAGSSLQVWSAYRLALKASQSNIPIAIVNYGESRADSLAELKIPALVGGVLLKIAQHPTLMAPCTN